MKMTGFESPNVFIRCFTEATGIPIRFDAKGKRALQTQLFLVRDSWSLTPAELRDLIVFTFTHNPLHKADMTYYSRPSVLNQTAKKFLEWRTKNAEMIDTIGVREALAKTRPDTEHKEIDIFLKGLYDG